METVKEILERAKQRASEAGMPYTGALLPAEAMALLQGDVGARVVDVRSRAEWDWVGRVPGAIEIEWQIYPGMRLNPGFLDELAAKVSQDAVVMFLCRTGGRSGQAAAFAADGGYSESYNILEGFEGDKDASGHRGTMAGWKAAGLPWVQG
jgi:rhodanese-related sulfurtransferase